MAEDTLGLKIYRTMNKGKRNATMKEDLGVTEI
jgi:hypothetical protein